MLWLLVILDVRCFVAHSPTVSDYCIIDRFEQVLESPDAQALFVLELQQSLAMVGMVKVNQVREIDLLRGIGTLARGVAIEAELENLPLKLWTSAILFRRGSYGN